MLYPKGNIPPFIQSKTERLLGRCLRCKNPVTIAVKALGIEKNLEAFEEADCIIEPWKVEEK